MKILLIHPQSYIHRFTTGIYSRYLRYAPITMPTLAALIPDELNASVKYIDEMIEPVDFECDADLVGITCISGTSRRAYEIADRFRERGSRVVLGGIHTTLMPDEARQHADSIVCGYAETTWPQLLEDFRKGELKKEYTDFEISPDSIVPPMRSIVKHQKYMAANTIEFSRGCGNSCEYCVSPRFKQKVLVKRAESVLREIERIPGKFITFLDPNLITDIPLAFEFFSQLRKHKKYWLGGCTVEISQNPDLLDLMVESGCKGLLIGFESLNQKTLDAAKKNFNQVNEYAALIKLLHRKGIMVEGCFMVGFDNDEPTVFQHLRDFVIESHIDLVHYTIYTPFPGTALFEQMKQNDRILTDDWSLYNGQHVVFKPKNMGAEDLQKSVYALWRKTYRYSSIVKRLMCQPWYLKPPALLANLGLKRYVKRWTTAL